ncbi:MAG TPA: helix-turn-helix domain-containing protein, partial [Rectinemataceae bacterium]|nr:helix-turn-helix domain-containing protein [Rectinemataceae bacterium]
RVPEKAQIPEMPEKNNTPIGPKTLEEIEKETIMVALARNSYHREKTAAELGITRRTLLNKIKEYDLDNAGKTTT